MSNAAQTFVNKHTTPLGIGRYQVTLGGTISTEGLTEQELEIVEVFKERGFLVAKGAKAAAPKAAEPKAAEPKAAEPKIEEPKADADEADKEADSDSGDDETKKRNTGRRKSSK